jgi:hypothetical protein
MSSVAYPPEAAVLWRLFALTRSGFSGRLEGILPDQAVVGTRAAFFLLDEDPLDDPYRCGTEPFVTVTLNRLLRQLRHNTEQQPVIYEGQVRGRIVWQATYKARYTQEYSPNRYACREVWRKYDTPENQMLAFMIARINECLRTVPEALRQGVCYFQEEEGRHPARTADRLGGIAATLASLSRNARLRSITVPESITNLHVQRALNSRMGEYATLVELYRRYTAITVASEWDGVIRSGRRALPLPAAIGLDNDHWIRLGAAILQAGI